MKKWLCIICGLIYDEAEGWPSDGIAPGTRWEDVPDDWVCPDCGVGKADFEMIEITGDAPASCETLAAPAADAISQPGAAEPSAPLVIIGSGHAGYGLAEAVRALDGDREIHVVTADDGGLYSKPSLSNAFALGKDAEALIDEPALAIERRLNLRIHAFCPVHRIDVDDKRLLTRMGELPYGQLVLATGAKPIRLSVKGDADALISVNDRADYQHFRQRLGALERPARITVIGDGLIGCEFANDLVEAGHAVNIVGLAERALPRLLPEGGSRVLQEALSNLGVNWYLGRSLDKIETQPAGDYRLILTDGRELGADLVISAVGLVPNTDLARDAGIDCGRGIRVDAYLATSQPDIYALGDAVEIEGQLLPYLAPINAGVRALAATLSGRPSPVSYPLMPVVVKTPAAPVCVVVPPTHAGEWRLEPLEDGVQAVCYDASGMMVGFALVGTTAIAKRSEWIRACGVGRAA